MFTRTLSGALFLFIAFVSATAHAAPPKEVVIPGERIFPESVTSTRDGQIIFGSLGGAGIFRAMPGAATANLWITPSAGGFQSILGVFADDAANTLWACSGVALTAGGPPPPAILYAFDLKTGAVKGRFPLPTAGALCNDIAVGKDGTVYVTDTTNMEIDRLPKGGKALGVWAGHGAFGPKGDVLDGIAILGDRVIVNALTPGKLFSVRIAAKGRAGAVAEITLPRPLARPDGMRSFGKSSLIVAESTGHGRVSRVDISGNEGQITVLGDGFAGGACAVTVVGTTAYVLEGQLASRQSPGVELHPFRASAVAITGGP